MSDSEASTAAGRTVESLATSFASQLGSDAADIFVSFFDGMPRPCVHSSSGEEVGNDPVALARHLYTTFGYQMVKNGPGYGDEDHTSSVEALSVLPAFVQTLDLPDEKLKTPLAIAKIAAEELPHIWELIEFLPGIVNTIKADLHKLGMRRGMCDFGIPGMSAEASLHWQAAMYASRSTRYMEAQTHELEHAAGEEEEEEEEEEDDEEEEEERCSEHGNDGDAADVECEAMAAHVLHKKRKVEATTGRTNKTTELQALLQKQQEMVDKSRAEYVQRYHALSSHSARPTGEEFNARVRITNIDIGKSTWSGVIWDGESEEGTRGGGEDTDKHDVCVEFEEGLLLHFRVGMIVTGHYYEMDDGRWVFTDPGLVWPSFYNEKKYIIW